MSDSFSWEPVFLTLFGSLLTILTVSRIERAKARVAQLESERAKGIERLHSQMVQFHNVLMCFTEGLDPAATVFAVRVEFQTLFLVFQVTEIYFPKRFAAQTRELLSHFKRHAEAAIEMREGSIMSPATKEEFVLTGGQMTDALRNVRDQFRKTLGVKDYEEGRFKEWRNKLRSGQFDSW